jgi:hypothetical protein
MSYTFEELKKKTVAELREIASKSENENLKGYSQLNKEHLLIAICKAFNIDMHEHHTAAVSNKSSIKSKILNLKKERDNAIKLKNHKEIKVTHRKIHKLKRALRKAAV